MEIFTFYERCSRLLSPSVKRRVKQALPAFKTRAYPSRDPTSLYRAALDVVRPRFPSSTPKQHDILAFYLLASAVESKAAAEGSDLDTLGGISQEMSLRLQMATERRQKITQTLSNILKKMSSTADSIVQNIK